VIPPSGKKARQMFSYNIILEPKILGLDVRAEVREGRKCSNLEKFEECLWFSNM
jgi:hypothetical protein